MKISPPYFNPCPNNAVTAVMEFDDKPAVKTFKLPYPTPSHLPLNRVTEFLFSSPTPSFFLPGYKKTKPLTDRIGPLPLYCSDPSHTVDSFIDRKQRESSVAFVCRQRSV